MKRVAILFQKTLLTILLLLCVSAQASLAAVGCDLNDADRDVPRLFPKSTGYLTKYVSIKERGGNLLLNKIKRLLGEKYLALYAPIDVPYTLYEIYNGKNKIGYIHGVNQKGRFGGIQVFMAQDLNGVIKTFYIQKISGQKADRFRDPRFYKRFVGLTLKDFDTFDPVTGKGSGKIALIPNPLPDMETDFYGILRGLKKNFVLMDAFVFSTP